MIPAKDVGNVVTMLAFMLAFALVFKCVLAIASKLLFLAVFERASPDVMGGNCESLQSVEFQLRGKLCSASGANWRLRR